MSLRIQIAPVTFIFAKKVVSHYWNRIAEALHETSIKILIQPVYVFNINSAAPSLNNHDTGKRTKLSLLSVIILVITELSKKCMRLFGLPPNEISIPC